MPAKPSLTDHLVHRAKSNGKPLAVAETPAAAKVAPRKQSKGAKKVVMIEGPKLAVIKLAIVGTTPLIVHSMSKKMALQFLAERFGVPKPPLGVKDPQGEFNDSRYISTGGWDGMHAGAFRAACVGAARMTDNTPMTELKRLIFVVADGWSRPLHIPELEVTLSPHPLVKIIGKAKMRTDLIRVDSGAPDIRFRAEYWPWSAIVTFEFNVNRISAHQVASMMALAGVHDGVGEGRPSAPKNCTGTYGCWKLKEH